MKSRSILLIDGERCVLSSLQRILREENYNIITSMRAGAGLDLLAKHPVQVVVSSQCLPEMSGIEFFQKVKLSHPEIVRVLLTGRADLKMAYAAFNQGEVFRFLAMPCEDLEFIMTVRQGFEHYEILAQNRALRESKLAHNIRISTARQMVVTLSHELNNYLMGIRGPLEMMLRAYGDGEGLDQHAGKLQPMLENCDRIIALIQRLGRAERLQTKEYLFGIKMIDPDVSG